MPYNHISIDLETMSSRNDAAIISIGAYAFDPDGPIEQSMGNLRFIENVELSTSLSRGLHIDGDTVQWWLRQSQEARDSLFKPEPTSLPTALDRFQAWLPYGEFYVWCHATFDAPILAHAYQVAKHMKPPWGYRNARDIRTICDLAGVSEHDVKDGLPNDHRRHSAEWDAWAQAVVVQTAWQKLKPKQTDRPSGIPPSEHPATVEKG